LLDVREKNKNFFFFLVGELNESSLKELSFGIDDTPIVGVVDAKLFSIGAKI